MQQSFFGLLFKLGYIVGLAVVLIINSEELVLVLLVNSHTSSVLYILYL